MSLEDLYRNVILDHYRSARNKGSIENPDLHAVGKNPSCGDELEIFIKLNSDKKVEQIHHDFLIKDFIGIEKIINKFLNV